MPARRPLSSDRPVVIRAALVQPDVVTERLPAPVSLAWDADAFADAFFGGLVTGPQDDPMFAGAADAGPLAQDGAEGFLDGLRLPAAFRSE
jgi:hypothetical protein